MLRKRLENGVDVVIQENGFSKMFALQCWVGVGSLHEEAGEEGITHCIEHMLFKGTRRFAVGDRKSTRLNSSHIQKSRMPSSA